MSEYQYYEFQAIDVPLTDRQMGELRRFSSRASITSTRFTNSYSYGNFKGDPSLWMEKYFDAFLYLANWNTHELMFRLPRRALNVQTVLQYMKGESASARVKGDHVILSFLSQREGGGEWVEDDEGSGWMSSLIPIREQLASGDLRALYLGWLLSAQAQELNGHELEPPVPAGLGNLNAPLQAFVDYFEIDVNLLGVAAEVSANSASDLALTERVAEWIGALPDAEKTALLIRLVRGDAPHIRSELLRRFQEHRPSPVSAAVPRRTVSELLDAAERRAEDQQRQEANVAAQEKARRERAEAMLRERDLDALAMKEPNTWRKIDELIATKKPADYDLAVKLLRDLHDLGLRSRRPETFQRRIEGLVADHAKKSSLIARIRREGLAPMTDSPKKDVPVGNGKGFPQKHGSPRQL